jgi:cell division protein ZapA
MKKKLTMKIADRDFNIPCEPEDKDKLSEAARMVSTHIDDIKRHGRTVGLERVAIMAALNLAVELLDLHHQGMAEQESNNQYLDDIVAKLEGSLAEIQKAG